MTLIGLISTDFQKIGANQCYQCYQRSIFEIYAIA